MSAANGKALPASPLVPHWALNIHVYEHSKGESVHSAEYKVPADGKQRNIQMISQPSGITQLQEYSHKRELAFDCYLANITCSALATWDHFHLPLANRKLRLHDCGTIKCRHYFYYCKKTKMVIATHKEQCESFLCKLFNLLFQCAH